MAGLPRNSLGSVFFFFLLIFLNLFFNWTKIALQCCVGLCCTITQISHNYTYTPLSLEPPSPPPTPLGHHRLGRISQILPHWVGSMLMSHTHIHTHK